MSDRDCRLTATPPESPLTTSPGASLPLNLADPGADPARPVLNPNRTQPGPAAASVAAGNPPSLADRNAGAGRTDRTQYLAAKAQLALASPARDEFRNIQLVLPLKTSLAKKRKSMESALAAYKSATDYRVAEVTTLATYEIAEIYRKLGQDIMKSERPKKLPEDQLEEYNSLLEEQAFPWEEQAIATHEINSKRTRDNVYDEGVRKSFAALAELKPARYAKTEMLSAGTDQLVPPPPPAPPAGETPPMVTAA